MKHLWLLAVLLFSTAALADADLDRVLACARANAPPDARMQQVELTSSDRSGGKRTLRGRLLSRNERSPAGDRVRALLKLDEPADLAGSAYLMIEGANPLQDGLYMYLPAIGRARRVSGTSADGPLLGTHFSYYDFRQMQAAFADSEALLEDPELLDQRQTHVLSFSPPQGSGSRYSVIRVWVDQQTCVPLKAEFRDGLTMVKVLTVPAAALRQSAKRWFATEVRMTDLEEGGTSVLRILGTAAGVEIPANAFDPATFYLGK